MVKSEEGMGGWGETEEGWRVGVIKSKRRNIGCTERDGSWGGSWREEKYECLNTWEQVGEGRSVGKGSGEEGERKKG